MVLSNAKRMERKIQVTRDSKDKYKKLNKNGGALMK